MSKPSSKDKREISHLIAGIRTDTDSKKTNVYVSSLVNLVALEKVVFEYKAILLNGLDQDSPEVLLASLQNLQDNLEGLLQSKNANNTSKDITLVDHTFNQMTQGEYGTMISSGNFYRGINFKKALKEHLRDVYKKVKIPTKENKDDADLEEPGMKFT